MLVKRIICYIMVLARFGLYFALSFICSVKSNLVIIMMDRRHFIKSLTSALLLPASLAAEAAPSRQAVTGRKLTLRRPQSGESLSIMYKRNGQLDKRAYQQICHLMRDVKADEMSVIDVRLLDIMDGIRVALGNAGVNNPTFLVQSAFRTWQTNREVGGVLRSYHTKGQAIDFHIPGVPSDVLFKWLKQVKFHEGVGIGYYAGKQSWLHLDSRQVGKTVIWEG